MSRKYSGLRNFYSYLETLIPGPKSKPQKKNGNSLVMMAFMLVLAGT